MRIRIAKPVQIGVLALAIAGGMELSRLWAEAPATQPAGAPTTQPAADADGDVPAALPKLPTPAKANISADAQAELDSLSKAYASLTSLELAGSLQFDGNIDGKPQKETSAFTSTFQSPNLFRHEMKEDLVVGSTGEKQYVYVPSKKLFAMDDAPKTRAEFTKFPSRASSALGQQNPALLFALSDDAAKALLSDATDATKLADEKIGDKSYTALSVKKPNNDQVVLIDPATHLVRQIRIDISKALLAEGASNVKSATVTFDYPTLTPNAPTKPNQFAWTPPEGAKDAASAKPPSAMDATVQAMVGKPAADFSLKGMDDKTVSLKDLKGSVVILDFWATWCGPCVVSLPELDKLYQAKKSAGLQVFAINKEEDKETVDAFVKKSKLTVPVLLDPDSKAGGAYNADGIPLTILIGKDGVVKKAVLGLDRSNAMEAAVDAELKAK